MFLHPLKCITSTRTNQSKKMMNDLEIKTGIKLPKIYLDIVDAFTKHFGSYEEGEDQFFDYISGAYYVHVNDGRGYGPPVEFFPFLNKGGDGEHYGYLVLAPELNGKDFPLACYIPGTGEIEFLGRTTVESIENSISRLLPAIDEADIDDPNIDYAFLGSLGIYPSLEKAKNVFIANYGTTMISLPIIAPQGWHFQMTHDGTGVLAKSELFDLKNREWNFDSDLDIFISEASICLTNGYWGSALVILKESWWFKFKAVSLPGDDESDLPKFKTLKDLTIKTYNLLNKNILAKTFEEAYCGI